MCTVELFFYDPQLFITGAHLFGNYQVLLSGIYQNLWLDINYTCMYSIDKLVMISIHQYLI